MKTTKLLAIALITIFAVFGIGCESKSGGSNNGSNNLPPDPGEAGKATLEGIDSNNNGIRDDLEIAIYNYAPKPEEDRLRAAMTQNAKARQLAIIAGHTKDQQTIKEADDASWLAVFCVNRIKKEYEKGNFVKQIERKAFNTPDRVEAYMRFNEALSGKVLSAPQEPIPCDYDRERETKAQAAFEQSKSAAWSIRSAFSNLPPDPEAEGKKTLEGIDANNNGIRDDVEIAIYNYAPREDQAELRQAMIQQAKSSQAIIMADLSDSNAVKRLFEYDQRASECLKLKNVRRDTEALGIAINAVRDTHERSKAYKDFRQALGRYNINPYKPSGDPNPCDYEK
jgi:hypothetical protein